MLTESKEWLCYCPWHCGLCRECFGGEHAIVYIDIELYGCTPEQQQQQPKKYQTHKNGKNKTNSGKTWKRDVLNAGDMEQLQLKNSVVGN